LEDETALTRGDTREKRRLGNRRAFRDLGKTEPGHLILIKKEIGGSVDGMGGRWTRAGMGLGCGFKTLIHGGDTSLSKKKNE